MRFWAKKREQPGEVTVRFVFLTAAFDVQVLEGSEEVEAFQLGRPSAPQVAGNGVEIVFARATVNKEEGLPTALMGVGVTLQGRLGNHADIRSAEGEAEVMHAVRSLVGGYIKAADPCTISTRFLTAIES